MVVHLAVQHHPYLPIFTRHGLVAASDIDDAQASKTKTQGALDMNARVVRTAIDYSVGHPAQPRFGFTDLLHIANPADDTTHEGARSLLPSIRLARDQLLKCVVAISDHRRRPRAAASRPISEPILHSAMCRMARSKGACPITCAGSAYHDMIPAILLARRTSTVSIISSA